MSTWSPRCAVVTGASGFIGRRLCAALQRAGAEVRAVMRRHAEGPWARSVCLDLGREAPPVSFLEGAECVFHLAAKVHAVSELVDEEAEYQRANVEATRRVLETARAAGAGRFVFFSSVKAMGEGGSACLDETSTLPPETAYGRSKRDAEHLVLDAAAREGFHAAVLRLPLVYGAGGRGNLTAMLRQVRTGRFPPLPEVHNRRSMVHVDDVVSAALTAAGDPRAAGEVFIVTDGEHYSTRRIYGLMCRALGRPEPRWSVPAAALRVAARVGDVIGRLRGRRFPLDSDALDKLLGSAWYSAGHIEARLGFRPSRDLPGALPDMVAALDGDRDSSGEGAR